MGFMWSSIGLYIGFYMGFLMVFIGVIYDIMSDRKLWCSNDELGFEKNRETSSHMLCTSIAGLQGVAASSFIQFL